MGLQALASNLKSAQPKARVFNLGNPPSDGPKPDGTYMAIPGLCAFSAAKAAMKCMHDGMKVEMKELADFGYGHPGLTRTSLTTAFHDKWSEKHPINGMMKKRFAEEDYFTPEESAAILYAVNSARISVLRRPLTLALASRYPRSR